MGKYKHGMSGTRIHNIWMGMLYRCKNNKLKNYGARGIMVCERWKDFNNFYEDMGNPPTIKHSIDRINSNGNYEPCNCKWSTRIEQARITRSNTIITYNGESRTIAEWSEIIKIKQATICQRLYKYKWNVKDTLTKKPIQKYSGAKPWEKLNMSRTTWYRRK